MCHPKIKAPRTKKPKASTREAGRGVTSYELHVRVTSYMYVIKLSLGTFELHIRVRVQDIGVKCYKFIINIYRSIVDTIKINLSLVGNTVPVGYLGTFMSTAVSATVHVCMYMYMYVYMNVSVSVPALLLRICYRL